MTVSFDAEVTHIAIVDGRFAGFVFFKQKTAYEILRSDWSSDVCSSDLEVEEAIGLANAEAFVAALPAGIDTEIGERGVKLSGGQKQRIAIARALLKGASILVLDEATSSLDSESEALIQDALEGVLGRRDELTTLVIAHRLSTIQGADRIHVLDAGARVESGRHEELLAARGLYAHLHALQAGDGAGRSGAALRGAAR